MSNKVNRDDDLDKSEIVQLVRVKSRVDILEERFDRHLNEMRSEATILRNGMDDLKKMMHNVEINQLQEQKATMMTVFRMILLNGGIGSLAGAVASLIVNLSNK